jgi:hypothetical protein
VLAITGELADLTDATIADATRVLANARRCARRQGTAASGRLTCALAQLDTVLGRAIRVVEQTRTRLAGTTVSSRTIWADLPGVGGCSVSALSSVSVATYRCAPDRPRVVAT